MPANLPHPDPDILWLDRLKEEALEPDLPIIDAHHHLYDVTRPRYLFDEILADIAGGHRIEKTVMVEAGCLVGGSGPEELRTLTEVKIASGAAAMSETGLYGNARICAGIVAHADLRLGERVDPLLDLLTRASGGRLRGIRHNASYDGEIRQVAPPGLLRNSDFQRGFERIQQRGYRFDAWLYHPQLRDLIDLMKTFPEAHVVLDHVGGPVGIGRFAGQEREVTAAWRRDLAELARFPNVSCKLGGLGMFFVGFGFHERPEPPSSDVLTAAWSEKIRIAIDTFGPARCMFESNFPVDKASASYVTVWNAFKKISRVYTKNERQRLFYGTAAEFYDI